MKNLIGLAIFLLASSIAYAQSYEAKVAYNKGLTYYNQQQFEYAIPHLEEAIAEEVSFEAAHHLLAECYMENEMDEKAIDSYKKVIEINPNEEKAMFKVAQLHLTGGQFEEAKAMLENALVVNPSYTKAKIALTNLQERLDKGPDYIEPELENATYYEANTLYKKGRYNDALTAVSGLNQKTPTSNSFYLEGICHQKLGDLNEALVSYKNAVKLEDTHQDAYLNMGIIYYNKNQFEQAANSFDKVVSLAEPATEEFNYFAGSSYYHMRQLEKAEKYLNQAIERDENSGRAHYTLSKVYENQGKEAKSLIHRERATELGYVEVFEESKVVKTVINPQVIETTETIIIERNSQNGSGTMPRTSVRSVNEMYEKNGVVPPEQRKAAKRAKKAEKAKLKQQKKQKNK